MTDTTPSRPGASLAQGSPEAKRTARFLVARFEKWFLPRMAERLPRWVMPDHLTALGIVAASLISAAYMLSNHRPAWLWLANAGLVVHWFGDSLDGTLARVRHIQRPRYGFYLDHLTDAYSTVVIGLGLGLSPYMLLAVALALVAMYLVLSINVYLETYVLGEFRYGYGWLGPTEARIALLFLNGIALTTGPLPFRLFGIVMTAYDVIGVVLVFSMVGLLLRRAARNLGMLARLEPPNVVKD